MRRVFLCGLARDFCVRWTGADAVQAGFEAVLLDDLCRAVYPDERAATDQRLAEEGVQRALSAQVLP